MGSKTVNGRTDRKPLQEGKIVVPLGAFAREAIDALLGNEREAAVRAALAHYVRRLELGPAPTEFPRFRRDEGAETSGPCLEVLVDSGIQRTLEREAQRCRVKLEQLAAHAVFVYLAETETAQPRATL